jgi:HEAT repeat protein
MKKPPPDRADVAKRILSDPFAVIDLYEQPELCDICVPLVQALEDPSPVFRRAAIECLVALNDLYAASSIYGTILHGSDHARLATVEILCRLPEPFSIPYLLKALKDPVAEIRGFAIEALVKIDQDIPKGDDHYEDVIQTVLLFLEDKREYVRETAVEVLIKTNKRIAALYLADILIYGSPAAADAAARVLKALAPPRSLSAILPELFLGTTDQKKATMQSLVNADASLIKSHLLSALGDPDGEIRVCAAQYLAKIDQPQWQPLIKGEPEDFKRLADSGHAEVAGPLIRALAGTDKTIQKMAKDGLIDLKQSKVVDKLISLLMLNRWEIRIPAAQILGALGDPQAVQYLIALSEDPETDPEVRIACVRALAAIKDQSAVDALKKILDKLEGEIRQAAFEALEKNKSNGTPKTR